MEIIRRVHAMKEITRRASASGSKVGLVPTMGYLHEGHLSLVRRVKDLSDVVVVSVFVNPTQFGPEEDFGRYPRDLARDTDLCVAEGVDYIFAPEAGEMYPRGSSTFVEVEDLSSRLEGESRTGHFRGVTTVVLKLFEIVKPDVAAFGQKDAQQAIVIQRMARDLMLDVEILVVPIVRDEDQVALSSRNAYLSDEERRAARAIPRSLQAAEELLAGGERSAQAVIARVREVLDEEPMLRIERIDLVDPLRLEVLEELTSEALLAVAVFAGRTRLIDNTLLRPPRSNP
jgi:pantoate--beta-alanine ligase